jgi:hypothetical protein
VLPVSGQTGFISSDLPSSAAEEAVQFRNKGINVDISPQIVIYLCLSRISLPEHYLIDNLLSPIFWLSINKNAFSKYDNYSHKYINIMYIDTLNRTQMNQ